MVLKVIGKVNDWKELKKLAFYNIENLVTNFYIYTKDTRGSLCETKNKNLIFLNIEYCLLLFLDIMKNQHQLKFSHKVQVLWYQG